MTDSTKKPGTEPVELVPVPAKLMEAVTASIKDIKTYFNKDATPLDFVIFSIAHGLNRLQEAIHVHRMAKLLETLDQAAKDSRKVENFDEALALEVMKELFGIDLKPPKKN